MGQKTGLFLGPHNFMKSNSRKACDISKFSEFCLELNNIICISLYLNIHCLICINRHDPKITMNLITTLEFYSIFTKNSANKMITTCKHGLSIRNSTCLPFALVVIVSLVGSWSMARFKVSGLSRAQHRPAINENVLQLPSVWNFVTIHHLLQHAPCHMFHGIKIWTVPWPVSWFNKLGTLECR